MLTKGRLVVVAAVAIGLIGCSTGDAPPFEEPPSGPPLPFEECVRQAQAIDVAGLKRWQNELRELVTQELPDFSEHITLATSRKLTELDRDAARFRYLIDYVPERIETTKGTGAFLTFAWSEEDSRQLRASSEEYGELERRFAELSDRLEQDPQRRSFAEHFREILARTRAYAEIVERVEASEKELGRMLKRCQPLETREGD